MVNKTKTLRFFNIAYFNIIPQCSFITKSNIYYFPLDNIQKLNL